MPAFARPMLLPIPTFCAITGHAFGAGLMFALGHDHRVQNADRGWLCAPEIEIGVDIPPPEMELFRHAMPAPAFYETTLEARRWSGAEALRAGLVQGAVPGDQVLTETLTRAAAQAKLAKASNRAALGKLKMAAKGHVALDILRYTFPKGSRRSNASLPAGLLGLVQKHIHGTQRRHSRL